MLEIWHVECSGPPQSSLTDICRGISKACGRVCGRTGDQVCRHRRVFIGRLVSEQTAPRSYPRSETRLRAGRPGFDSWQEPKIILFLHRVHTASRARPTSYAEGTLGFPQGVNLITHLHPVPRSGMVELSLHSFIHLHGVMLNSAQGQFYL